MQTLSLYNTQAKEVGKVDIDEKFFNGKVNQPLLRQVLKMYAANRRRGTASTKTRKDVRGGGRKPWKQKGTGRARAGTIRSPLWRGGGVTFGPHPRDFSYTLPQKIKRKAIVSALNIKFKDNQLVIIDRIELKEAKTKEWAGILAAFKINESCLVLLNGPNLDVQRAGRNISNLFIKSFDSVNAAEIYDHRKLIVEKEALEKLVSRFTKMTKSETRMTN